MIKSIKLSYPLFKYSHMDEMQARTKLIQACVIFVFVISSALWPWDFETQDIDDRDVEEKALRT